MILMRGHHFICLHFFSGEGYSRDFVENLYAIVERTKNEKILIVEGADDICKKCPFLINGACKNEEEISEMDKNALQLLNFKVADTFLWDEIKRKLHHIFNQWYSIYCISCSYFNICSNNALQYLKMLS